MIDDDTSHMNFKAIDLFAGCGGISEGLRQAGFSIVAAADNNKKYSATYKQNFPDTSFIDDSLASVNPLDLLKELNLKPQELDLLTGGPPCQGFSKNVPRKQRETDSRNNLLVNTFLEYCEAILPRAILMENVAEMRNGFGEKYTRSIVTRLTAAGYLVSESVLNAADYGVPQKRRRAFFVAVRDSETPFTFPLPTHSAKEDLISPPYCNVKDAIGDLPRLKNGDGEESSTYESPANTQYQKNMRKGCKKLYNHKTRKLSDIQFERLNSLEPGQGIKDLPAFIRPKGGYSGAYGRLTWSMVAPTITRWVFHPGSGRWGHPEDIRVLTTRETARIQSFPDTFRFYGTFNDMAGQLGNAVPPILAQKLGVAISKKLSELSQQLDQVFKT